MPLKCIIFSTRDKSIAFSVAFGKFNGHFATIANENKARSDSILVTKGTFLAMSSRYRSLKSYFFPSVLVKKKTLLLISALVAIYQGCRGQGKAREKRNCVQGQGKVREFFKKSGKIFVIVKASETSGNSVFRFIVRKFS